MPDVISGIDQSISLVRKLAQTWKKIGDADMRSLLADLQNELADARLEMADLKQRLAAQADEIRTLNASASAASHKRPKIRWGCYEFEDEEGLFCIKCWETKGRRSPTNRLDSRFRQCAVCQTTVSAG